MGLYHLSLVNLLVQWFKLHFLGVSEDSSILGKLQLLGLFFSETCDDAITEV